MEDDGLIDRNDVVHPSAAKPLSDQESAKNFLLSLLFFFESAIPTKKVS